MYADLLNIRAYSAHQMGSCRIGGSAAYAVFDPHGECWEAANLFVADASGMIGGTKMVQMENALTILF